MSELFFEKVSGVMASNFMSLVMALKISSTQEWKFDSHNDTS